METSYANDKYPRDQNRAKIDDFIAIYGPINRD